MKLYSLLTCCPQEQEESRRQPPVLRTIRFPPPAQGQMQATSRLVNYPAGGNNVSDGLEPPSGDTTPAGRGPVTLTNFMSRLHNASVMATQLERLHRSNEASTTQSESDSATSTNSDVGVAEPTKESVGACENGNSRSRSFSPSLQHVGSFFQPRDAAAEEHPGVAPRDGDVHAADDGEVSDHLDDAVIEVATQVSVSNNRSLTGPTARAEVFVISDEAEEERGSGNGSEELEDPTKHLSTFVEADDDLGHQDMVKPVDFSDKAVQHEMEAQAEEAQANAAGDLESESDADPATFQSVDSLESVDLGNEASGKQ